MLSVFQTHIFIMALVSVPSKTSFPPLCTVLTGDGNYVLSCTSYLLNNAIFLYPRFAYIFLCHQDISLASFLCIFFIDLSHGCKGFQPFFFASHAQKNLLVFFLQQCMLASINSTYPCSGSRFSTTYEVGYHHYMEYSWGL